MDMKFYMAACFLLIGAWTAICKVDGKHTYNLDTMKENNEEMIALSNSAGGDMLSRSSSSRDKRAIDVNKAGVTEEEIKDFVDRHNYHRSKVNPTASNMKTVVSSSFKITKCI